MHNNYYNKLDPAITNNYYNASINIPYRNLTIARQTMIDGGFVGSEADGWTNEKWIEVAESESPLNVFKFMFCKFLEYGSYHWNS